jgi:hypothetical protein
LKCVLTLTDITRMREGRICIAGVDEAGRSIRPVVPEGNLWEDFLTSLRGHVIGPFTRLGLDLLEHRPEPPHTEDWTFNPWTAVHAGELQAPERRALLERILDQSVRAIFGARIHGDAGHYVMRGEGSRSLGTVRVSALTAVEVRRPVDGDLRTYITFADASGARFRLPVTDLAMYHRWAAVHDQTRNDLQLASDIRRDLAGWDLIVRVGLARNWEKHPNRCHLQITGVYTFGGRPA